MKRKSWLGMALLGTALLTVGLDIVAQVPSPIHVIPVIGKLKGNSGTDWVSDVMLSNLSTFNGTVGVRYFAANTANTFDGSFPKAFALGGGKSLLVKDAVATWFPSAGTSTLGFLVIADLTPANCSTPNEMVLAATSRTYNNADPKKTYGQSIPSSWVAVNFTRAKTILTGLRQESGTPGYRSNIGVVNLSTLRITVVIKVYRADASLAANVQKTVEALSLTQWGLGDLGVASLPATGAYATVELAPGSITVDPCDDNVQFACLSRCGSNCGGKYTFSKSGTFIAYVSKVDNGSGDAEFIPGQVDWSSYNDECSTTSGQTAAAAFVRRFGLDRGAPASFRKLPQ